MDISLINPEWHGRFLEHVKNLNLSDEAVKQLYHDGSESGDSQDFITAGETAVVPVKGPLTKARDPYYSLYSGSSSTYDGIIKGIKSADSDAQIKEIRLKIDSPGGNWIGLTETVQAIAGASKPVVAEIMGMATSAAYILAAQADHVLSSNDSNDIGGLGVITRVYNNGSFSKTVRSSNAGKKNPDAFTADGEKELVKQLDAVEAKAIKMVSEGRSAATKGRITEKMVTKDFGQGASLMADEALKLGMIDEITPAPARVSNSVAPAAAPAKGRKLEVDGGSRGELNQNEEVELMDLNELRQNHRELYDQLIADGRKLERDQVVGHIIMAEGSGATELCLKNLKEGKEFGSAEVQAGYMSAGMNRKDLQNREDDNVDGDIGGEGGTELNADQQTEALIKKTMELSNKPSTVEV